MMNFKKVKTITYRVGDEDKIKDILFQSNEPIVLKIEKFTNQFTIDYFVKHHQSVTNYSVFEEKRCISHQSGAFTDVLQGINAHKAFRIFGEYLPEKLSNEVEKHVPLWQSIPLRPKYFKASTKITYFFGGKGAHTAMHYDREQCCLLHLCLSGKKRFVLFTEDQSDLLYKTPFISDSIIPFNESAKELEKKYPKLKEAKGYDIVLESGDMLFMPKNCWHYTEYLDGSTAACFPFYPKKYHHFLGLITGYFYVGYMLSRWGPNHLSVLQKFAYHYAVSTGLKRSLCGVLERCFLLFLFPYSILLGCLKMNFSRKRRY